LHWDNKIHKFAEVSEKAEIGENVEIGAFTVIEEGVKIGDFTKIENNVHIKKGTIIGKNCHIHSGCVLGDIPQDLNFKGGESFLIIGDNVVIRENCVFHRASGEDKATIVEDGAYLMTYTHIAHNVRVGKNVIIANGAQLAGYVEVEEKAFLSGLVAVHQFVRIGRYAMIGGCTKLIKDVPPYTLCDGNPARVYGLNLIGLKRAEFSFEKIKMLKDLIHILYKDASWEYRLKEIEKYDEDEAKILLEFLRNSNRGITEASWRRTK